MPRITVLPIRSVAASLIVIGGMGPPVFLLIATLAGWLQPGYDRRVDSISQAALGSAGWLQPLNVIAFGVAIAALAAGYLRLTDTPSHAATGALLVAGVLIAAAGVLPTDPTCAEESTGWPTARRARVGWLGRHHRKPRVLLVRAARVLHWIQ